MAGRGSYFLGFTVHVYIYTQVEGNCHSRCCFRCRRAKPALVCRLVPWFRTCICWAKPYWNPNIFILKTHCHCRCCFRCRRGKYLMALTMALAISLAIPLVYFSSRYLPISYFNVNRQQVPICFTYLSKFARWTHGSETAFTLLF